VCSVVTLWTRRSRGVINGGGAGTLPAMDEAEELATLRRALERDQVWCLRVYRAAARAQRLVHPAVARDEGWCQRVDLVRQVLRDRRPGGS
jgi:hypothetical protein